MRLPLDFTRSPPAFAAALDAYARSYVRKGVPSLFADLKPLCAEGAWSRVLFGEVVAGWVGALEATGAFPDTCEKEPPSTLMWARVLLAQYYDSCGDTAAALSQLDMAIGHTPTCLDLYLFKARCARDRARDRAENAPRSRRDRAENAPRADLPRPPPCPLPGARVQARRPRLRRCSLDGGGAQDGPRRPVPQHQGD